MVAFFHEQVCDCAGGRCRHRHGGFIGFQLDQRLSFRHLIAFFDQDLDDVTAFDAFSQKRQFDFHGYSSFAKSGYSQTAAARGTARLGALGLGG